METAIYYPSIGCNNRELVKEALFLWDKLEFIVPDSGIPLTSGSDDKQLNEAIELVGHRLVPSKEAKEIAHNEILDVVSLPDTSKLKFELSDSRGMHGIYPQKFMNKTWEELKSRNLYCDGTGDFSSSYVLDETLGLYMMSALAVSCAGGVKRVVTDKVDAYKSLYNSLSDMTDPDESIDKTPILTVPFKGINLKDISFARLLHLRKKEDDLLRELRTNYVKNIDNRVKEIEGIERVDLIKEVTDDFADEMERELRELKRALRINASKTILSKEFAVVVLGIAMQSIAPVGGALSAGVLLKSLVDYRDKRREILKKSASSWLFMIDHQFPLV